jgi:hypothetical protein
MSKDQIEDVYYKLFDEETVKLRFTSFGKFASFRTKLYKFKGVKDMELEAASNFTYDAPMININIHYIPGSEAVIAIMKFKEKTTLGMEFVEFDEVTQTWIEVCEATQHE